jgi:phosphate-selective porin OprO/OprP
MMRCARIGLVTAVLAHAQQAAADDDAQAEQNAKDEQLVAGEPDQPPASAGGWNTYEGRLFSARFGGGLLLDFSTYNQNAESREQMALAPDGKVRDFRLLLSGKFQFAPRISYTIGYMYDGADDDWHFRRTGLNFAFPEFSGDLFIGRDKEGFSTSKITVGYFGWTMERSAANDAFIPVLADGAKWTGRGFGGRLVYNLGFFFDALSETEGFNKNDRQFVTRFVALPFAGPENPDVLHIAVEYRYGVADDGALQYRSKPESFEAQSFAIDTGMFPASYSNMFGAELYYRAGQLTAGSEYYLNKVKSNVTGNPFFHGGDAFVAYMITDDTHPYNEKGAFFEGVKPTRPFDRFRGSGAWEVVLRLSYADLDSAGIDGGQFTRLTPMLNWYASENVRWELVFGFSLLERMNLLGTTQYFQTRLQLTL